MSDDRWNQVAVLFETATSLPPDERAAYLAEASGGDAELRREVEALLAADLAASGFLERAVGGAARDLAVALAPAVLRRGQRLGPYEIIGELGQGGMGTVYLASRADDAFRKTVAIKAVRRGADDPEIRRRFVAERQILANLEHPFIAHLLDGGTTAEGVPFVVIEHVAGEPLDVYCDRHQLTVAARLKLFLMVCEAVQYAHGRLVVHRDLKPSNILVTADGTPKLLDFGIAKLLDAPTGEPSTRTAVRLMTPEYASPEQVRGSSITTATDVYSLCVVLYELLAGQRPFRAAGDHTALESAIREQAPEAPSAVAARADPSVARSRSTRPDRWRRDLEGDLDTIILMGLRKEPERRYASVEQLAHDVRNHLTGLPVRARRDTLGYRTSKFVRRHRGGVVAATAVVALTGFYITRVAIERDRARVEAAKSDQVSRFLQDLFRAATPSQTQGRDVTARELVDRGAARLEGELASQPEIRATLLGVIGNVYQNLGAYDTSVTILRQALDVHRSQYGPSDPRTARVMATLGGALANAGDMTSPDTLLRESLRVRRASYRGDHPEVVAGLAELADYLKLKDDLQGADSLLRNALAMQRRLGGDVASLLDALGGVLMGQGKYADAEPYFREAVDRVKRAQSVDSLTLATAQNNLAGALADLGKRDESEQLQRSTLDIYVRYYGPEHPFVGAARVNLGRLLRDVGRFDEAEAQLQQALDIDRRRLGADHPTIAVQLGFLAGIHLERKNYERAESYYRDALAIRRAAYGDEHAYVAISINELAGALHAQGDLASAERNYRDALRLRRRVHEAGHPYIAFSLVGLGRVLIDRDRAAEAEPLLEEALDIRLKALPATHYSVGQAQCALGEALYKLGRRAQAESLLVAGLSSMRAARPNGDSDIARAQRVIDELRAEQ